ncbi:HNH endonuclease [Halalkalibacter flavus]|uniref:HNH endonuclease n=1 Tax=Halalkalibacter flavus TaxID=3090668 RepID=UPI002FC5F643
MHIKYYDKELKDSDTGYLILDTKGDPGEHGDIEFISYDWSPSRFNKIKVGDLFLYRRPQRASERGKFYFFGAGKIDTIEQIGEDRLRAFIGKPLPFEKKLLPGELEDYIWHFKQRGSTWEHFFNEYGMNQIVKDDFKGMLNLAFETEIVDSRHFGDEIQLIHQQQKKNYFVDDHISEQKTRIGHKVFADKVKLNYGYKCAITGLTTKEFLVASHIVPWSESKEHRLDPQNGICLSVLLDKAFDKGYIGISSDYRIKLAPKLSKDKVLYGLLKPYSQKKLKYPKLSPPKQSFLEWHLKEVFNK